MSLSLEPASVLVGVDGSPGGASALSWAATYAANRQRPLVIVHAAGIAVVTDFAIDIAATEEGLLAASRRVTEHALAVVAAEHPTVAASAHGFVGDPRAVLRQQAEGASVLVLGSRGRGALASLLLGSVSIALAGHAPCPVVVVRPSSSDVPPEDLSVVVGVADDVHAADALAMGFELAMEQHRSLVVLHAVGGAMVLPHLDSAGQESTGGLDAVADHFLSDSLEGYTDKFPEVTVHSRLVPETPTQALVAASRAASVVVVGCRSLGSARSHLLGSVSRSVVERAHCTVIVLRDGEA